jgi:thioesterase domain-containing protein
VLLLLENVPLREAADVAGQPWFRLYHFLSTWRPDLDLPAWAHDIKGLAAHPHGFQRQVDAITALHPEHVTPARWAMLIEGRLRQSVRAGYHFEELVSSWTALYCQVCHHTAAVPAPAADAQGGSAGLVSPDAQPLPALDEFLLTMFALEADPQTQLDVAGSYKPAAMVQADWDTEVGKLLAQVSYLKAINSSYAPVHALQPSTARLLCHGARHKSVKDVLEGWAVSALRPVALLLQPLRLVAWSDSRASSRDLEAALLAASRAASGADAARSSLVQGLPVPPRRPSSAAPAAAPAVSGLVGVHALNRFCWDTATQPHVDEARELAARAALPPGTDMTPADVAARAAAAQAAALAARTHALLLSTLPMWFVPGEAGACSGALQQAARLLPMPAYGLSLHFDAAGSTAPSPASLPELALQCVQQLLAVQETGPWVLAGCGVFSCMLAAAMARELEQQQHHQQVVLVLLDGPPVLPSDCALPDPAIYGLYELARDAGRLPAAAESAADVPQAFAGFAADASAALRGLMGGDAATAAGLLTPVSERQVAALEAAAAQVAAALLHAGSDDASQPGEEQAVTAMLRGCRHARVLSHDYTPEFVYAVPAVLVLTEDGVGQAFLGAARESCGGELSLVPLAGLAHGEMLTGVRSQQSVVVALVEGLMEVLATL